MSPKRLFQYVHAKQIHCSSNKTIRSSIVQVSRLKIKMKLNQGTKCYLFELIRYFKIGYQL